MPDMNKPVFKLFPQAAKHIGRAECPVCGDQVRLDEFRDELSLKEFSISGMCQECQDSFFEQGDVA